MYNYNYLLNNNYLRNTTPSMSNINASLYNPKDGYNNGNLFVNLYSPYKDYKPVDLVPTTEQGALLLEISRNAFAAHDLNLYLDLYPNDNTMLTLFNDYRKKANELTLEYENNYGPLNIASDNLSSSFLWEEQSWPWEGYNV